MIVQFKKGFTLAEMLVVITILAILGVLILNIFTRSLKGSNKSLAIGVIKQNGQSVLENMDKTIRGADAVVCASSKSLVVKGGGIYTRFRFVDPTASTNGMFKQDNPVKEPLPGTSPPIEETDAQLRARICPDSSLLSSPVTLTDLNVQSGVSVNCKDTSCATNPIFTREQNSGYKDQITILFDLKPGISSSQIIDAVSFQTTITLR